MYLQQAMLRYIFTLVFVFRLLDVDDSQQV